MAQYNYLVSGLFFHPHLAQPGEIKHKGFMYHSHHIKHVVWAIIIPAHVHLTSIRH